MTLLPPKRPPRAGRHPAPCGRRVEFTLKIPPLALLKGSIGRRHPMGQPYIARIGDFQCRENVFGPPCRGLRLRLTVLTARTPDRECFNNIPPVSGLMIVSQGK
jgi:hypothetical protein